MVLDGHLQGGCEIRGGGNVRCHELHAERLGGLLHLLQTAGRLGCARVGEKHDPRDTRCQLPQQLQAFPHGLRRQGAQPRHVSAGPGQAGDKPGSDRIGRGGEDDRDRARGTHYCLGVQRSCADTIRSTGRATSSAAMAGTCSDDSARRTSIAMFWPSDVPQLAQACAECLELGCRRGAWRQVPDPRNLRPAGSGLSWERHNSTAREQIKAREDQAAPQERAPL